MRKTISYSAFTLSLVIVVLLFVTAKDYTQLAVGIFLYPVLGYLALTIFPHKPGAAHREITVKLPIPMPSMLVDDNVDINDSSAKKSKLEIADVDRRAFLKLIGVAGISYFIFSIFSKKAQIPFFGKLGGTADSVALKNVEGKTIDPAERQPLDGFQISEIDDSIIAYYGFINKEGAWYIMKEDTETSSYRYAKGETSFPQGWTNRAKLKYDYFHNI